MSIEQALRTRSGSKCELCGNTEDLNVFIVPPKTGDSVDDAILACTSCLDQIENPDKADVNHWRCLNDAMWSQVPAVQVMAWRMLNRLRTEGWPQNLLDMLYLDDETLSWARAEDSSGASNNIKHVDSNGTELSAGDTVTLIKDLNVKGANFTAKRGTAVRGITLVTDNPEHIEGKVNGQQIVILTRFVKKAG